MTPALPVAAAPVNLAEAIQGKPRGVRWKNYLIVGSVILLALGLCAGLARIIQVPFNFNVQINMVAFLFATAVGIQFGYTPARRAEQLNPIDALRHE